MSALKAIPRVNEYNEVVGETTIPEAIQNGWPRRLVRTYVFDTDHQILLQRRSATIIGYPCLWDGGAAGHVDVGEDYETAAARELQEELGIGDAPLELIELPYRNGINFEGVFRTAVPVNVAITINTDEVEAVRWVRITELDTMMQETPDIFVPDFVQVWKQFHDKLIQY